MDNKKLTVALNSIKKIQEYKTRANYGRAFAHYLVLLELQPEQRGNHQKGFREILTIWGSELEDRMKIEELYTCYLQALHYFPENVVILTNFGSHLLRLEQEYQAKRYLQLAHNINTDYLPAEKNLETVKINLVPRWHYRMLNDHKRNRAYRDAIISAIDLKYNRILDIGTGCGLLSLFASQNKHATSILAVEESQAMSEVAKEIIKANNVPVQIYNKNSVELQCDKRNVLITEIFDTALFGEHVLETLIHAHKNQLEEDCRIVPSKAHVYITGIECVDVYKKQAFINCDLKHLKFSDLYVKIEETEPYDAEHIVNYPHKLLTDTCKFITVDFKDLRQLEEIYNGKKYEHNLNVTASGNLHAFIIWFDLELNDEVTITTNPFKDNCKCWEQAIVLVNHPSKVYLNNQVKIEISCPRDKLHVEIVNESKCDYLEVSKETIAFLNDRKLMESLEDLSQNFNGDNLIILDLHPVPIFGLILASRNAHVFSVTPDPDFTLKLCSINKINTDNITLIDDDDLFRYLQCKNTFDIICYNAISQNGTINEKFYSNAEIYANSLKDNGVILPQSVSLNLRLVASDYLDYCNRIDDREFYGFEIGKYMNDYAVFDQWSLDQTFCYNALSDVVNSTTISLKDSGVKICDIKVINSGEANGIYYWYDLKYFNNINYDTLNSDYYKKGCVLLQNKLKVSSNDVVKVKIKQQCGLLKLSCI